LVSPRAGPESIYANIVSGCEEWSNARTPVAVPIGLDFGQNPLRNFDFRSLFAPPGSRPLKPAKRKEAALRILDRFILKTGENRDYFRRIARL